MSGMLSPAAATISSSASANGAPRALASRRPIEVLPAPMRPDQHDATARRQGGGAGCDHGRGGVGDIRLDVELRGRRRYKAGSSRSEATSACARFHRGRRRFARARCCEDPDLLRLLLLAPFLVVDRWRPVPRPLGHPGAHAPGRDRRARRATATLAASPTGGLLLVTALLPWPAAGQEDPRALFPATASPEAVPSAPRPDPARRSRSRTCRRPAPARGPAGGRSRPGGAALGQGRPARSRRDCSAGCRRRSANLRSPLCRRRP